MASPVPDELEAIMSTAGGREPESLLSHEEIRHLIAAVSHDISNALIPIIGLADRLRKQAPPESSPGDIELLMEATLRVFNLCQKLTCFALAESRGEVIVDLVSLLRDAERLLKSKPSAPQLELEIPRQAVFVRANPVELLPLILCLLGDATPLGPGGPSARRSRVRVRLEPPDPAAGGGVRLELSGRTPAGKPRGHRKAAPPRRCLEIAKSQKASLELLERPRELRYLVCLEPAGATTLSDVMESRIPPDAGPTGAES